MRGIGGGFVLSMRRTFLARLLLEFSSSPVGASALRLMDDESAIVVFVVVVVVVVLLELPASGQNLWPN